MVYIIISLRYALSSAYTQTNINIGNSIMNNFWQFSWRDIALTKSNKHLRKSLRGTYHEKPCMHKI